MNIIYWVCVNNGADHNQPELRNKLSVKGGIGTRYRCETEYNANHILSALEKRGIDCWIWTDECGYCGLRTHQCDCGAHGDLVSSF